MWVRAVAADVPLEMRPTTDQSMWPRANIRKATAATVLTRVARTFLIAVIR